MKTVRIQVQISFRSKLRHFFFRFACLFKVCIVILVYVRAIFYFQGITVDWDVSSSKIAFRAKIFEAWVYPAVLASFDVIELWLIQQFLLFVIIENQHLFSGVFTVGRICYSENWDFVAEIVDKLHTRFEHHHCLKNVRWVIKSLNIPKSLRFEKLSNTECGHSFTSWSQSLFNLNSDIWFSNNLLKLIYISANKIQPSFQLT